MAAPADGQNADISLQAVRQWTMAQSLVSAYLGGIVVSKTDRDDLLQETAVAVLTSYSGYGSSRPFEGWVLGIAQNVLRNHFWKLARERLIFDDALMESLAGSFATVRGEQAARLDRLEGCLAKLLPSARDVCDLRYREELSLEAIATLD
jgi:RNA polymerase sigma-70 factor (ECF subfamily)